MNAPAPEPRIDPAGLIACPTCDMLHREVPLPVGGRLRCRRCGTVLLTNRANAIDRALAGSIASVVLMLAAIFFPFLELSIAGLHRKASLLDAAMAFSMRRRERDFGIRIALGATPRRVLLSALGESAGLMAAGLAFGLALGAIAG